MEFQVEAIQKCLDVSLQYAGARQWRRRFDDISSEHVE
jgi:hypothetical protein